MWNLFKEIPPDPAFIPGDDDRVRGWHSRAPLHYNAVQRRHGRMRDGHEPLGYINGEAHYGAI